MKTIIGFFVSPAIPFLLVFLMQINSIGHYESLKMFLALTPIGYAVALVFGVPIHMALKKRKIFTVRAYIFCGAILGLIPYAVLFVPTYISNINSGYMFLLFKNTAGVGFVAMSFGVVASFTFWFIAVHDYQKVI